MVAGVEVAERKLKMIRNKFRRIEKLWIAGVKVEGKKSKRYEDD